MQWYFLVASLGELRQKKVYTKGALTGKKRLWWDDSLWQIVCLPTLESLMVPTTLKSFHSSAVNKHLWNEGWFKYKITAAVGVCLSIICSATQVCKRFAYDGLCDCPFSDGICSLQKQMKGFQMSHKGSSRFTHKVQRHEHVYSVQKSSYFSLQYPIQHARCICLVDETEQCNRDSRTDRVWRHGVIKAWGHVRPYWSPD